MHTLHLFPHVCTLCTIFSHTCTLSLSFTLFLHFSLFYTHLHTIAPILFHLRTSTPILSHLRISIYFALLYHIFAHLHYFFTLLHTCTHVMSLTCILWPLLGPNTWPSQFDVIGIKWPIKETFFRVRLAFTLHLHIWVENKGNKGQVTQLAFARVGGCLWHSPLPSPLSNVTPDPSFGS